MNKIKKQKIQSIPSKKKEAFSNALSMPSGVIQDCWLSEHSTVNPPFLKGIRGNLPTVMNYTLVKVDIEVCIVDGYHCFC